MQKQIITIIGILVLINLVSAIDIFAGDCNSIEFPNEDDVEWSVEGNSSDMEGFNFTKTGTTITYCFDLLYKPDNFTITFYNYQSVEVPVVEEEESGGGGGYYTYPWRDKVNITSNETIINETTSDEIVDDDVEEIIEEEEKKISIWVWIIVGVLILLIVFWIIWYVRKKE